MIGPNKRLLPIFGMGRRKEIGVLVWSGAENVARQVLSLVMFFVCVRYLQPADLGVFALGVACSAIPSVLIDEPIGEALVQRASVTRDHWDCGFTANLTLSIFMLVALSACSPALGALLGKPSLIYVLPTLSMASVIGALGNIQKAYLARELRFREIAQTTLVSQMVGGASGLGLAVAGYGYWALVCSLVVTACTSSVIYSAICPWKPRLRANRHIIITYLPYVYYSAVLRAVYLLRDQSPLLLAGLNLSLNEVGYLSLALRVARCLGQLFEEITSRPLVTLISREQHLPGGSNAVIAGVLTTAAYLAAPAYLGLALVGPSALPIVFGQEWQPAAVLIPMLCVVSAGWLLTHIVAVALRAQSMGVVALRLCGPVVVIDTILLAVAMTYGLHFALMAWAVRSLMSLPLMPWLLRSWLRVDVAGLARALKTPAAGCLLIAGSIVLVQHAMRPSLHAVILTCVGAAVVYGLTCLILSRTWSSESST